MSSAFSYDKQSALNAPRRRRQSRSETGVQTLRSPSERRSSRYHGSITVRDTAENSNTSLQGQFNLRDSLRAYGPVIWDLMTWNFDVPPIIDPAITSLSKIFKFVVSPLIIILFTLTVFNEGFCRLVGPFSSTSIHTGLCHKGNVLCRLPESPYRILSFCEIDFWFARRKYRAAAFSPSVAIDPNWPAKLFDSAVTIAGIIEDSDVAQQIPTQLGALLLDLSMTGKRQVDDVIPCTREVGMKSKNYVELLRSFRDQFEELDPNLWATLKQIELKITHFTDRLHEVQGGYMSPIAPLFDSRTQTKPQYNSKRFTAEEVIIISLDMVKDLVSYTDAVQGRLFETSLLSRNAMSLCRGLREIQENASICGKKIRDEADKQRNLYAREYLSNGKKLMEHLRKKAIIWGKAEIDPGLATEPYKHALAPHILQEPGEKVQQAFGILNTTAQYVSSRHSKLQQIGLELENIIAQLHAARVAKANVGSPEILVKQLIQYCNQAKSHFRRIGWEQRLKQARGREARLHFALNWRKKYPE